MENPTCIINTEEQLNTVIGIYNLYLKNSGMYPMDICNGTFDIDVILEYPHILLCVDINGDIHSKMK